MNDPYANLPALYDLEHNPFEDDVALFREMVAIVGDPVLELGCGTGRIALALAQDGHRVTGLDASGPMLGHAAKRAEELGLESLFTPFEGDMTAADRAPGGPFGVVIIGLDSLLHLPDAEAQVAALEACRRALDPRGQLIIDVVNPTLERLRSFDGSVVMEGSWTAPDGTQVTKFGSRRLETTRQHIDTVVWYDEVGEAGAVRRTPSTFTLRYIPLGELELMLKLAGFPECAVYGSYELDALDDSSERIIVAAEVTPTPQPA